MKHTVERRIESMKKEGKYFEEVTVLHVLTQICQWLSYKGKAEVVRGNIHPKNLVLFDNNRVEFENILGYEELKSKTY